MSKTAFKSVCLIIVGLMALAVSIAHPAGAAGGTDANDTVELKNGDKVTGTLLTDTFTISSPYTLITVKKEKISVIRFDDEYQNQDVIELNNGGLVEGTIEETEFSFKPGSGKIITLEKNQCKKIVLKRSE